MSSRNNSARKMSDDQVRRIFKARDAGMTQAQIGRRFGLHRSTVFLILSRATYKDVKI